MNEKRMNQRSSADCRSTCIESPLNGDLAGGHESALFRLEGGKKCCGISSIDVLPRATRGRTSDIFFFFFSFFVEG